MERPRLAVEFRRHRVFTRRYLRRRRDLFHRATRVAYDALREEFLLGVASLSGRRGHLVWPDDRKAWLDVHRSIHYPASLRALCNEQVSPSRTDLFLSAGADWSGVALDERSGRKLCFDATMELAWPVAGQSCARVGVS